MSSAYRTAAHESETPKSLASVETDATLWRSDEFRNAEVLAPAMLEKLREAQAAARVRSDLELPEVARPEPGARSPLQVLLPLLEPLVMRLGESRQLLLGLRYVEGLTYPEIATAIGTTPAAAKRRLQRVHARLLRELQAVVQEYDGPDRDRVVAAFRMLERMRRSR